MDKPAVAAAPQVSFETHPSRYRHWTLAVDGEIARLTMKVQPFGGQDAEVELGGAGFAGDGRSREAQHPNDGAGFAGDGRSREAQHPNDGAGFAGDGPEPQAK